LKARGSEAGGPGTELSRFEFPAWKGISFAQLSEWLDGLINPSLQRLMENLVEERENASLARYASGLMRGWESDRPWPTPCHRAIQVVGKKLDERKCVS
jgi:hypothetical protein